MTLFVGGGGRVWDKAAYNSRCKLGSHFGSLATCGSGGVVSEHRDVSRRHQWWLLVLMESADVIWCTAEWSDVVVVRHWPVERTD